MPREHGDDNRDGNHVIWKNRESTIESSIGFSDAVPEESFACQDQNSHQR